MLPKSFRILHLVILTTLLFLLSGSIINTGCSRLLRNKSAIVTDNWSERESFALSLSRAILQGMRTLIHDLLISEIAFKDTDISIMSGGVEILRARITDFVLHRKPTAGLFTRWRIYLVSHESLQYISTITFSDIRKTSPSDSIELEISSDALYMDIYESSVKFVMDDEKPPSTIRLVYWRDVSKKDKLASLYMKMNRKGQYSTKL